MKRRAKAIGRVLAGAALPMTAFARRKLMELEGRLIRMRYFSDGPSTPPPNAGYTPRP